MQWTKTNIDCHRRNPIRETGFCPQGLKCPVFCMLFCGRQHMLNGYRLVQTDEYPNISVISLCIEEAGWQTIACSAQWVVSADFLTAFTLCAKSRFVCLCKPLLKIILTETLIIGRSHNFSINAVLTIYSKKYPHSHSIVPGGFDVTS